MSDTQSDGDLGASQFDEAMEDRPALDVEPGDAGPVQEDDDLPEPDEHQGENDDEE